MSDRTPLRGVAIGAGYFSQFHYDAWSRIPEVEIVALCDLDESRARSRAEAHGVRRRYTDCRAMLEAERPDFVDVITRPASHLEIFRETIERGIDTICQKPLAPTFDEAREIVDVAKRHGVRFMVHENFRFP